MSKKILVTGATGNIAGLVVPELIKQGADVRVLVRSAEKGADLKKAGAEVVTGTFEDQESLNRAAEGVDAVLAITPPNENAVAQGENILRAAKNAGTPFYLRMSAIGAAADAPTENGKLHYQSDEAVRASGLPYTILRPHFFMQNLFMSVPSIQSEGKLYWGMGEGKLAMVDVRDIADSVVKILIDGGQENQVLTLTGPEAIDFNQIASIISEVADKEVTYVPVPLEAVRQAILDAGWGEWGAQIMVDYSKAYSENWGIATTEAVESITGNKPRNFAQFAKEVLSYGLKQPV